MKKILTWEQKHGGQPYDISTPNQEEATFLSIFKEMLEQGDYECCPPEGDQVPLFEKAKAGDAKAAKAFLMMRSELGYEYEGIQIQTVRN